MNKKFKTRKGESIDENRNIENIAEVKSSCVIDCAYAGKDIGKIIKNKCLSVKYITKSGEYCSLNVPLHFINKY